MLLSGKGLAIVDHDAHVSGDPLSDYSANGVDLTLVRWMLSLTPAERLQFLQNHVNGILAIRALNGRV
jgi:hypothetical protein